ncbi:MAG: DsbA family protein [Pseudomonadota bacterium]
MKNLLAGAAIAAVFGFGGFFAAQQMQPEAPVAEAPVGLTDEQKAEVAGLVRTTLVAEPDILEEASVALEARRSEQEAERQREVIGELRDDLFRSATDHVSGDLNGDVTLVEFFDYNCPYCRRAMQDVLTLMGTDPNLRVVFKEFPVLSQESEDAALIAVAVQRQDDKYFEFHRKLMEQEGYIDEQVARQVAGDVGVDMTQLDRDLQDPSVRAVIDANRALGDNVGINGTPAYVVGDRVLVGAAPVEEIAAAISELRQQGCQVC